MSTLNTIPEGAYKSQGRSSLSARVIEALKQEIDKQETRTRLKCAVDPLIVHVTGRLQPYLLGVAIALILILILQMYTLQKLRIHSS